MKHLVLVVVLDVVTVGAVLLNWPVAGEEEDGLGKPKFSIPKFEGGADVEEYLTWELKIEKLWCLHDYTEDRKVKLASSEFDGYALRWWDGVTRTRQEENELPVRTWREMKTIMTARFVPTNYLRTIYDKLTLLRQGVKIVDEYFMEMEMLMQRGRVRESLEMTVQRFLHSLKYDIKGIVRYHCYTTMSELLHHAREAKAQLAEAAQIKSRSTGSGRYTPRAPPSTAPRSSSRPAQFSTPSSKPVSNVSNTRKSEPAASASGSSISTARNRDMNCHTCGGKGHFKRDCPNRKVMIVNEDNEYETGDDVDPYAPEDDEYDTDAVDAYSSDARTIVVSQHDLNVLSSASTQRCNLFQTKALVGPDKACKESHAGDLGASRSTPLKGGDDEDIPTSLLPPSLQVEDDPAVKLKCEEGASIARGGEEQLDKKMDVKLDMELDMKRSHGRAREREACAREEMFRRRPAGQPAVFLTTRSVDRRPGSAVQTGPLC
ncbi:hypothetical protein QYE76_060482 [Lolium multiflorum]|uniref:CCHC-type domain-containing protein n=1 Tax=Lolium multiflorum TaxID=4521 RepID=A0AAD8W6K6_LOLMU|nr:hypothetical protein QYE76_060482 [Lolium multiflorum]